MDVELRHLRALVALAESDTFTTAAAVLGTTQPTLSRTITQLETIVGARLVTRTTRAMDFTPAGRRLTEAARELLDGLDVALSGIRGGAPAPLRLGWAWAGLGRHTLPLLQAWRESGGGAVEVRRPDDPLEAVRRRDIDAAILRRTGPSPFEGTDPTGPDAHVAAEPDPAGLATTSLFTEKLVAAVAVDDPRAVGRRGVTLDALAEGPLAVCATAPTVTSHLWAPLGHTPRTVTVANTDEWLGRIALGEAVGVTAEATTYNHRDPGVAYLAIDDAPTVDVVLARPAHDPHPAAETFAECARAYFAGLIEAGSPPLVLTGEEPAGAQPRTSSA